MKDFKYFYRIYRKYLSDRIWFLLFLTIVVAFLDGLGISMLMPLLKNFDLQQESNNESFLTHITDFFGITDSIGGVLTFMFLLFLLKAIVKFYSGYFKSSLSKTLFRNLKIDFYSYLLGAQYEYFTKKNTGFFITVMETHTKRLVQSFHIFVTLITTITLAFTYVGMAAMVSWQVALMAMALGSVIILLMSFINKFVRRLSQEYARESQNMNQIAIQAIHAFKYIVSTGMHKRLKKQFTVSTDKLVTLDFKTKLAHAFTDSIKELMAISLLISMIVVEVIVRGTPIGSVFVVLLLFYRGVNNMMTIQSSWQQQLGSLGFVESVDTEMEKLKATQSPNGTKKMDTPLNEQPILFKDLSFEYQDSDAPALKRLNFDIKPNTTVAFVGTSGSGKTTLVDVLTGLLSPSSGGVQVGDDPLTDIQLDSWRTRIGYVSQDLMIFDDSVAQNICMFDEKYSLDRIRQAATAASALSFIEELPDGFDTRIGDKGVRLSGGQRQRLFIARELYKNPDLLILDEATSALDSASEQAIQKSIDKLHGKVTVLIIAHRLSTIKNADKIIVLEKGEIVEQGTYQGLTKEQGETRFAKMVEGQSL